MQASAFLASIAPPELVHDVHCSARLLNFSAQIDSTYVVRRRPRSFRLQMTDFDSVNRMDTNLFQ